MPAMQTQEIEAGSRFGPYTIEGLIAGGGMGAVYAARHSVYGSAVALKVLHAELHRDAEWRARFSKEGMVGLELKHPHILSARDLIMEDDGRVALVLDLVQEGKTLLRVMSREFPEGLPLVQALQVLLGLIQGVEYAHDKGVVHGDIKPENVLIHGNFREPRTWVPKLTDFGTVGILAIPVTIDGQPAVVVSPRYASPEHVLGMDKLEPRSDIYCLGLLLHYLLTGQHASNAATVQDAADTVMKPVPLAALVDQPDTIVKIFQRATRIFPEERFASCRAFAMAIRDALDSLGARLDVDDLTADLATELMEDRKDARKALWDSPAPKTKPEGHVTAETAIAADETLEDLLEDDEQEPPQPEDVPVPTNQDAKGPTAPDLVADEDTADEDTADHDSPFGDGGFSSQVDDEAARTVVPSDRDYEPLDVSTPAPVGTPLAEPRVELDEEPEGVPVGVWVAVGIAALVIFAGLYYSI